MGHRERDRQQGDGQIEIAFVFEIDKAIQILNTNFGSFCPYLKRHIKNKWACILTWAGQGKKHIAVDSQPRRFG